ncbi:unnamed protein product [Blepharisma stoltei]|uniref:Uncharacterized protein n=1 Tax=Blepharisma stoltei TaxID=1481888 RepID=A0AAU9JH73_9CILI|nr:unnamed protein product [Blepharisma stoltei]
MEAKSRFSLRQDSSSFEDLDGKFYYLNTAPSLKSSVTSQFKSSFLDRREELSSKPSISSTGLSSPNSLEKVHALRDTEADSSIRFDTSEDFCMLPVSPQRYVGNFQKNYLECGQWPDTTPDEQTNLKKKYQQLQKECGKSEAARAKLESELEAYKRGKIPCNNCKILKEKNKATKRALEEAVQLSNLLLSEVHRLDSELRQPEFSPRSNKKVTFTGFKM